MAKIYERLLSTILPQGKGRDSFDAQRQNLFLQDCTWMVDCLEIPQMIDHFFFLFDYMIELVRLF